ncbi:hypothetical protein [Arcticibacter eurypsychrophilus]|uniref:hypothetical protein n=1 Tax=Arcticibacter eurypsychrophilus TaxID=1434752 RepID=UPI00084DD813|nr:hypothetical protein [Arcticibacter eurypsychrophilus]
MLRSFQYTAYSSLYQDKKIRPKDISQFLPHLEQWYHYMIGFFMQFYLQKEQGANFIPKDKESQEIFFANFSAAKSII